MSEDQENGIDATPLLDTTLSTDITGKYYLDENIFDMPTPQDSTLFGTFQILINTAIGSGTLMIPFCYRLGIVFALFMSAIIGLISLGSFWMMMYAAFVVKKYDFRGLWNQLFKKNLIWILLILIEIGLNA